MSLDQQKTRDYCHAFWKDVMEPKMMEFARIPNLSPNFDPDVHTNGLQEQALEWAVALYKQHLPKNAKIFSFECKKSQGQDADRTPLIIVEIPATDAALEGNIVAYHHLDCQPHLSGWTKGGPTDPVVFVEDGRRRLYARGPADDGYGGLASMCAVKALEQQNVPHCRVVLIAEFSEESGSCDLPYWITQRQETKDLIGTPDLVVCLDAGNVNYSSMDTCMSLRGVTIADIDIDLMSQPAMHSGLASGVVPDVFRIVRILMNRLEDAETGEIKVKSMHAEVPQELVKLLEPINKMMPHDEFMSQWSLLDGVKIPGTETNVSALLRTTWEPSITLVGYGSAEGANDALPAVPAAGNVCRGRASFRLSCRLPPTADPAAVAAEMKSIVEANPPFGVRVSFHVNSSMGGWVAPKIAPWLDAAMNRGSNAAFGTNYGAVVVGGGIPLMLMLSELFPKSQFCITGVLGPNSNAHAPDEFLDLTYGQDLNIAIAYVLADASAALQKQ